ncbi:hypothetical protein MPSEU_000009500 [Mayamaea pseudoterrestris]|nr:hypothetical protein MPSEU_000009500 [Mayamaea pseudoterrestris]
MKINLTNAINRRKSTRNSLNAAAAGNEDEVKPKPNGSSARKPKAALAESEALTGKEPYKIPIVNIRATRSKAKADEVPMETEAPASAAAPASEKVTKNKTKGKAKPTDVPAKTQSKEAVKEVDTKESETKANAAAADNSKTDEIEAALAAMDLTDKKDQNMDTDEGDAAPVAERKTRFGRKLLTPKKYKDYILGAARRDVKTE